MKITYLFLVFLISCVSNPSGESKKASDTTVFTTNDTIPEIRKIVKRKPVASYVVQVNDPRLERTFGVDIFETPLTFQYLMRMHYEAMVATDTLKVPNFGIWPVVEIHRGKDRLTCIIGFLDKKNEFKECKMVTAQGEQMKLIVLKKYFTGRYKNVSK